MGNEKPTHGRPGSDDRRAFLRRSFLTGAVAAPVVAGLSTSSAEAAFNATTRPQFRTTFEQIRGHENDHVAALLDVLGDDARPKPTFQKLEKQTFLVFGQLARTLENVGVGAYLGAAPAISSTAVLASAGSIALIEARHAGALNYFDGLPVTGSAEQPGTDNSFESPLTAAEVVQAASKFIASLNNGPPLTYSNTPSAANDIAILNFALALEYLEAEFYNINVPKFYPPA